MQNFMHPEHKNEVFGPSTKTSQTLNRAFNEIEKKIIANYDERAEILNQRVDMSGLCDTDKPSLAVIVDDMDQSEPVISK